MSNLIHTPTAPDLSIQPIHWESTTTNNLRNYYLSAFTREYVKTPAEIAKNDMNPTKINSIYLTPFVLFGLTNSW
jgi:hypothetical protein